MSGLTEIIYAVTLDKSLRGNKIWTYLIKFKRCVKRAEMTQTREKERETGSILASNVTRVRNSSTKITNQSGANGTWYKLKRVRS